MAASRIQIHKAIQKPYDRVFFSREVLSPVFGSGFTLNSSLIPAAVLPNKSGGNEIFNSNWLNLLFFDTLIKEMTDDDF